MAEHDYKLAAGAARVVWPWLCPKPVIVQRFTGNRDRPLCEFLRSRDPGAPRLSCDQDKLRREICARLAGDAEAFEAIGCRGRA